LVIDVIQMTNETGKKHSGECFDCGGPLELIEFNAKEGSKILKCLNCGLLHYYKKDFLGSWRLQKATKIARV